jgi:pimeloyl-ACP methyl ester carboxylesterase
LWSEIDRPLQPEESIEAIIRAENGQEPMPPNPLTTSDIPPEYWEDASLVGNTPFKAASFDQRASYCMYVPKKHYQVNPPHKIPLVVTIHGSGRDAAKCRDSLVDFADRVGAAVLAPLFPAGVNDPNDTHNYKRLCYQGIRYDSILLAIIDEIAVRWPGIATEKFFLTGYSGGGQFALKFFYLHPAKLEAVSIGAPGVVTHLDDTLTWPGGTKGVEELFGGLSVDISGIRKVEGVQLIVGGDDVQKVGGGLLDWLRRSGKAEEEVQAVGPSLLNRKDALMGLHQEFESTHIRSEFQIVDGVAHDAMGVLSKVIEFLEPHLTK